MRKQMIAIVAMFVGFGMVSPVMASAAAVSTKEVVQSEMVRGRIVGVNGAALSDALISVTISGATEVVLTTRTADDGSYKLALPLLPGTYTLRVLHIGYAPVSTLFSRQNNAWTVPDEIAMRPITSNGATFGFVISN